MKSKKLPLVILVIFVLIFPAVFPLIGPGYFNSDDGNQMVTRLFAFHETLKTGQIPVRFVEKLNHGFGYPVLNFLYPLPFYIGEIIHLLGFNYIYSIKILFALAIIFGAFSMALWAYYKWGIKEAIFAAVFYTYSPYKIMDVYKRGSLGEVIAFTFIPLIFYSVDKIIQTRSWKFVAIGSIFYAALITSHNVLAFIFTPVILLYILFVLLRNKISLNLISKIASSILLGVLAAAFFWIPVITDLQYTWSDKIQVSDFTKYFLEHDQYPTHLGILIPLILILGTFSIIRMKKLRFEIFFWVLICLGTIFLALPQGKIFWDIGPLPRLVQFPWRFLSITLFSATVIGCLLISKLKVPILTILIIFIVCLLGIKNISIDKVFYPESFYTGNDGTTTVKNEYLPKWQKNQFLNAQPSDLVILNGLGKVIGNNKVQAISQINLRINRVYFPGWKVKVDGVPTRISYENEGFIEINIPPGNHYIDYHFTETSIRYGADLISLISILIIIFLFRTKNTRLFN